MNVTSVSQSAGAEKRRGLRPRRKFRRIIPQHGGRL